MKTVLNFVAVLIFAASLSVMAKYCNRNEMVDRQTFEQAHNWLNLRIDTVISKVDTVSFKVDSLQQDVNLIQQQLQAIHRDIDSLRMGQVLIYSAIKQMESRPRQARESFLQRLRDFFEF